MKNRILIRYTAERGLNMALSCSMEDRRIAAETLLVLLDGPALDRVIASAQALKASRGRDAGALRAELDEPSVWLDRYYTPGPPDAPGAAPLGAVDWQDYGAPIAVPGLRRPARGWVEYDRPLSPGQVKAYGLLVAKDF